MKAWKPEPEKPLVGVARCKETDCENDRHCFLPDRRRTHPEGTCLSCGVDLVDWPRVRARDIDDVVHTVEALKLEKIRHEFWCEVQLSERAVNFARRLGRGGVLQKARERIRTKLKDPGRWADYGQVPFEDKGDAIHCAQHATGTCCRKCIEAWHGIARSASLKESEIEYMARLIQYYVIDRIPDLKDEPIKVPRTRKRDGKSNGEAH